jgi:hypothetical protein
MRPKQPVEEALRRPDLPWPDETGAYDHFLRRRARRRLMRHVSMAIAAAALIVVTVLTAHLLPGSRQATRPPATVPATTAAPTETTLGVHSNEGSDSEIRQLDPEQFVARGKRAGFSWILTSDRIYQLDSNGNPDGGPQVCTAFSRNAVTAGAESETDIGCFPQDHPLSQLNLLGTGLKTADRHPIRAVTGWAPAATARVRLELADGGAVVANLVGATHFSKRFYVAFVPLTGQGLQSGVPQVSVIVALDARGGELARLQAESGLFWLPPTDEPVLVATATSPAGPLHLYAYHHDGVTCVTLREAELKGVCDLSDDSSRVFSYFVNMCGRDQDEVYGPVPPSVRTIRFTFADHAPIEVRTAQGPAGFGRAYFVVALPRSPSDRRAVALDAGGKVVGTSEVICQR